MTLDKAFFATLAFFLGFLPSWASASEEASGANAADPIRSATAIGTPVHESPEWLHVERSETAQGCPSTSELQAQILPLLDETPEGITVRVAFGRQELTYSAELRLEGQPGERRMSDTHYDCAPLARAVATAAALLIERDLPEDAPRRPTEDPIRAPSPPERIRATPQPRHVFGAAAQVGASIGMTARSAPAIGAEAFFTGGQWRIAFGALKVFPRDEIRDPGGLEHQLLALSTKTCLRALRTEAFDIFGCTGALFGKFRAKAFGYTDNLEEERPWIAFPAGFSAEGPRGQGRGWGWSWLMSASMVIPLRQETFVVDGLGTVLETNRVGGLFWAGLAADFSF